MRTGSRRPAWAPSAACRARASPLRPQPHHVVRRPSQDTASSEGRCMGQCSRHLPLGPHGRRFRGPRSHPGCTASPVSLICKTRIIRQPAPSVGVRLMWVRHARVQPMLAFPIAIWSPKGTLRISLASRNQIEVEEMERKREEGGGGRRPRGGRSWLERREGRPGTSRLHLKYRL